MDEGRDFVQWLGQDLSLKILMCLEDPCDLLRTSSVLRSWREFVIGNGLCKKFCLRKCPKASSFARVVEAKESVIPKETGGGGSGEWACLERENRVYVLLCRDLMASARENCITYAICASSTDNYPDESIKNTLEPNDRIEHKASYWSSKGVSDPSAPETLIYKLVS